MVVVVAAAGRIYSLHCTALQLRKGGSYLQVHTIPYHNDNNETGPSWMVQVQMEGGVNWKVVSRGAYMEENAKG